MVGPAEAARRTRSLMSGRLHSLPILAMSVHSACNCRCVMCDIWKANSDRREISVDELERHVESIRRLHVQRVMLTGGEPLLHRNLWALCARLQELGIRITLVTTGMLIEPHANEIAASIDTVVISLDGDSAVHDAIRRVKDGFARIAAGVTALRNRRSPPRLIARCVVQRRNASTIADIVAAAHRIGFDELSFLAADVSSTAFNRAEPWSVERASEVAIPRSELPSLVDAIDWAAAAHGDLFANGFVTGGRATLDRICQYYRALAGDAELPRVRCNAPWVSAVLEPGGHVRPCFFHQPYEDGGDLDAAINAPSAIAFRRSLDVARDPTCRRCVCSLSLPVGQDV